ncbi:uncharacterized protein LOC130051924 [Ostrea edulis]|uniref:uncharacterized protein LOC130051924 n=1 Tax=Ostrea edulis TaxID=37623 RepID=UPI0024AECA78|nr:uncharacterized protein LOC130051924 [Ostrea edulis]
MPFRHAGESHEDSPVPKGQIRTTTGFMVQMVVQGVRLQAVVDTGAEGSVLSTQVYEELDPKPPIKQHVTLVQAGENARMRGFIIGPVAVRLGDTEHNVDLYVAPLQDQMLLGMEFLHQQKTHIDLEHGTMTLGEEKVPMTFRRPVGGQEAQVSVTKSICQWVPAASVVLCPCCLDKELEDFVVSPQIKQTSDVLSVPHTYARERTLVTSIVNASDEEVSNSGGSAIGSALEAEPWVLAPDLVVENVNSVDPHTEAGTKLSTFTARVKIAPLACPGTWSTSKEAILDGGGDFPLEPTNIAEEISVVEASAVGLTHCAPSEGVQDGYNGPVSEASWNYVSRELLGFPGWTQGEFDFETDLVGHDSFRIQVRQFRGIRLPWPPPVFRAGGRIYRSFSVMDVRPRARPCPHRLGLD